MANSAVKRADLAALDGSANVVHLAPAPQPKRPRDRRIDVFRGICLLMIFINHVPGTVFEHFTSRNFGFSDAAEAFVFISGTSAALAYAGGLAGPRLWPGISRIWGRAWTLYLVNLLVMVWALGLAAAALRFGGDATMLGKDNMQYLSKDLAGTLIGLPVLAHQIGYVNILPMYAVLLLAAPGLLIAAIKAPRLTLAASLAVWLVAGLQHWNIPNFPMKGGWFLNPISWQLIFVLGMLTGLALRRGQRFVPRHPVLIGLAVFVVAGSLVWLKVPAVGNFGNATLGRIAVMGVPSLFRDFDKTFLSVPRLIHALALIYLISALPVIRRLCDSRWAEGFALLGRVALPVFALGTILSFAARAAKEVFAPGLMLDSALILGGCAVLWAFAATLQYARAAARPGSAAAAS